MEFSLEVDIEFDILDAAIYECLPGYTRRGWIEYNRVVITPASTRYDLLLEKHGNLGDLGSITVRKIDKGKSLMFIRDPERPIVSIPNKKEWEAYNLAQYPKETRIKKQLEVLNQHREEAKKLFEKKRDHQKNVLQALFNRLADDSATAQSFSGKPLPISIENPVEEALANLQEFKYFIEREAYKDLYDDNGAQEKYARLALQAFIVPRSYREVPVRAGRSDILVHIENGRLLYEAKIWRGENYHNAGITELSEYIHGENSDGKLLGVFYVIFDPSKKHQAELYIGSAQAIIEVGGFSVNIFVVNLAPDIPSKKGLP